MLFFIKISGEFMKKWNLTNRLWHWANLPVVIALIVTSWFKDSDLAVEIMRIHVYLGFGLAILFAIRIIYLVSGKDSYNIQHAKEVVKNAIATFKSKKFKMSKEESYHFKKGGAKLSYLGLIGLLSLIILTGLGMRFGVALGLADFRHTFKEIHEVVNALIILFSFAHIFGVISGELTYEPNIVSDMINGGKKDRL
jgi:cytochrome b